MALLAVQLDCTVSRKVMREYVPRGKPDGTAEAAMASEGLDGMSGSLPPLVGVA